MVAWQERPVLLLFGGAARAASKAAPAEQTFTGHKHQHCRGWSTSTPQLPVSVLPDSFGLYLYQPRLHHFLFTVLQDPLLRVKVQLPLNI